MAERTIRPKGQVLEALKGEISDPVQTISNKPGLVGEVVTVRLVKDGPGMIGLKDALDNREWAGIFNHPTKVGGAIVTLGRLLDFNGQDVDVQGLLDTGNLSHAGRRHYDESTWYPQAVEGAEEKSRKSDTELALPLLRDKGVDERTIEMVSVHGVGVIYPYERMDSWNKKLPMYLDFRIAQNAMDMEQRFVDLQRGVPNRYSQEFLDRLHEWARQTERELFEALRINSWEKLTENPRNLKARIDVARKLGRFSPEQDDILIKSKAYTGKVSGQTGEIDERLGLSQEEFLGMLQLGPEDINDSFLQPERWERYLRRLYINDAEEGIYRLYEGSESERDRLFPQTSWWGSYVRELIENGKMPYRSMYGNPVGIDRAIEFFQYLDTLPMPSSEGLETE